MRLYRGFGGSRFARSVTRDFIPDLTRPPDVARRGEREVLQQHAVM